MVHLLGYISYKKNLGLKYYAKIYYAPLYDLLIQDSIKTESQLMVFSDSICQDCPYYGIITGVYRLLYQCGPIDHFTHVPVPVSQ